MYYEWKRLRIFIYTVVSLGILGAFFLFITGDGVGSISTQVQGGMNVIFSSWSSGWGGGITWDHLAPWVPWYNDFQWSGTIPNTPATQYIDLSIYIYWSVIGNNIIDTGSVTITTATGLGTFANIHLNNMGNGIRFDYLTDVSFAGDTLYISGNFVSGQPFTNVPVGIDTN